VGHLLAGDPAAAREALASLRPTVRTLRGWFYATGYRAVASAELGDVAEAAALLAEVRVKADRDLAGLGRVLDLCEGYVEHVRTGDVDRARALLTAGTLVTTDDGLRVERPQDPNLARILLERRLELTRHRDRARSRPA